MSGEIREVVPGVFCLPTDYPETVGAPLWLYLFQDHETVLCDAATSTTFDATLSSSLGALRLAPSDLSWALLTHGHPDHTGAVHALRAAGSRLRVAAPLDDVPWIESFDRQWREFWQALPGVVDVEPKFQEFLDQSGGDLVVDRILRDGDVLATGERRFRAVFTRGHTPGHAAYLEESSGVLLTGDLGLGRTIASSDGVSQYPALYLDVDDHVAGLHRVRELDFEWLCAAHALPVDRDAALESIDAALDLVDEVEDLVLDAVLSSPEPITLRELAELLGRHLGMMPPVWSHTAFVARAHLDRAARRGLVEPAWRRSSD